MPLPSIIPGVKRHLARTQPTARDASAKRTALDPAAAPFVPRSLPIQPTDEEKVDINLYLTEANQVNQFDPCYYVTPSFRAANHEYSSELVNSFNEEDRQISTAKAVYRPAHDTATTSTTEVVSNIAANTYASTENRDPLPPPPATPSLTSTAQFPSTSQLSKIRPSEEEEEYDDHRYGNIALAAKSKKSAKRKRNPLIHYGYRDGQTPGEAAGCSIYQEWELLKEMKATQKGETYVRVGRYRKAALWEFVGHTYERYRRRRGKKSDYQRFASYTPGQFPKLAPTNLRHVETVEYDEDVEMTKVEAVEDTEDEVIMK